MLKIEHDEFKVIAQYIYDVSGVKLEDTKKYLVETRFAPILAELECSSYSELYSKLKTDLGGTLKNKIVDAITTQETLFFRDASPFEILQHKVIPELIDHKSQTKWTFGKMPIRIWCAASSTGQEPYSIAITLKEMLPDIENYAIEIVATDISDAALAQAKAGRYNKFEVERGMNATKLQKYFTAEGMHWHLNSNIRNMVTFKKMNLMEPFSLRGKFDIVFCRNVTIYFTPEDKLQVFDKIGDVLDDDGYLIIGSTEFLAGTTSKFMSQRHLRSVFYKLKPHESCDNTGTLLTAAIA